MDRKQYRRESLEREQKAQKESALKAIRGIDEDLSFFAAGALCVRLAHTAAFLPATVWEIRELDATLAVFLSEGTEPGRATVTAQHELDVPPELLTKLLSSISSARISIPKLDNSQGLLDGTWFVATLVGSLTTTRIQWAKDCEPPELQPLIEILYEFRDAVLDAPRK